MPSASPHLFTARSKLAEVYVINATINLATFIVCPNSPLFLTRGTILYWSLFANTFEKFPLGLKHSFIFLWNPLGAFFRPATRCLDAKIKLLAAFPRKTKVLWFNKDNFNHVINTPWQGSCVLKEFNFYFILLCTEQCNYTDKWIKVLKPRIIGNKSPEAANTSLTT